LVMAGEGMKGISLLRRENVFRGKIVRSFHLDEVMLPNGAKVRLECIDHPGAAAVVPYLKPDRIVLLSQFRPVVGKALWEIPAGTLKRGERPRTCALRELAEETGFKARKLKPVSSIFTTPGFTNEVIHIFKATGLSQVGARPDADEILETAVFSTVEIRRMVARGMITDSKTISGLALCGLFQKGFR